MHVQGLGISVKYVLALGLIQCIFHTCVYTLVLIRQWGLLRLVLFLASDVLLVSLEVWNAPLQLHLQSLLYLLFQYWYGIWCFYAHLIVSPYQFFHRRLCLRLWQGGQIYCSDFGGWGPTSFNMAGLDCIYLYVQFLNPFPLTVIQAISAVVAVVSKSPAGSLPNFIFGVAVIEPILLYILNNREESCAVI